MVQKKKYIVLKYDAVFDSKAISITGSYELIKLK